MPTYEDYRAAFARLKSKTAVAAEFGVNESSVRRALLAAERAQENPAHANTVERIGANPASGGWLRHYDPETGKILFTEIIKSAEMDAALARAEAATEALLNRLPAYEPIRFVPSAPPCKGLVDLIPIFDGHLGMYAWHREGGADWNLDHAQRLISGAVDLLTAHTPRAETGILAFGGDWRHYENPDPTTNLSKHIVSTDTRIGKVQAAAVDLKVALIDMMLTRYREVIVLDMEGNHDIVSPYADLRWLRHVYRKEPRLTLVDDDALPYYALRVDKVFLGFHHGHLKGIKTPLKRAHLMARFATSRPGEWAKSVKMKAIHTGHLHSALAGWDDDLGVWFEQHPTMAAADSHGARNFPTAQRGIYRITYDGAEGEVERKLCSPDMVRRMEAA